MKKYSIYIKTTVRNNPRLEIDFYLTPSVSINNWSGSRFISFHWLVWHFSIWEKSKVAKQEKPV